MKHFSILFLFSFITTFLTAQTEWAPLGATWDFSGVRTSFIYPLINPYQVSSVEEIEMDGLNFRVLDMVAGEDNEYYPQDFPYYIHQKGDSVFYLNNDTLRLIYHFGANVGDSITFELMDFLNDDFDQIGPRKANCLVANLSFTEVGNQMLHQFECDCSYEYIWDSLTLVESFKYVYYEKIGSLNRVIEFIPFRSILLNIVEFDWLRCYSDADIVFKSERFLEFGNENACDIVSSVNELDLRNYQIYPNPVGKELHIEDSGNSEKQIVFLMNSKGQTFQSVEFIGQTILSVEGLPKGVYFLKILKDKKVGFQKFLVL